MLHPEPALHPIHHSAHHFESALWAIVNALDAHLFSVLRQALLVLDLVSKRSELRRLPFPFKSWKRKYKLAFHLIAGDESAEPEILPAQALLIPWAGRVWHRARAGKEPASPLELL